MNDKLHKLTNSSDNQHSITQTDPLLPEHFK